MPPGAKPIAQREAATSPGSAWAAAGRPTSTGVPPREHRRPVRRRRAAGPPAPSRQFPKAKKFRDFRKMLDEMDKQIDAVVVGTPDHTHAPPAAMAHEDGQALSTARSR